MKTASRYPGTNAARPPFKTKPGGTYEPDRIIMPIVGQPLASGDFRTQVNAVEYTDYEEVASSNVYDELAFQEYAGDDATRLRKRA